MTAIIKIIETTQMYGASNEPVKKYPANHEHSNRTTEIIFSHANEGGDAISLYNGSIVMNDF